MGADLCASANIALIKGVPNSAAKRRDPAESLSQVKKESIPAPSFVSNNRGETEHQCWSAATSLAPAQRGSIQCRTCDIKSGRPHLATDGEMDRD